MLPAETERLILRAFRDEDAEAFAAYRSDPRVAEYQGWDAPYAAAQARLFVAAAARQTPGTPGEWYQIAMQRVRANCDAENLASARLLERLGMRREGHFVQSLWFKGRWSSELWYAVLRAEWTGAHGSRDGSAYDRG